MKKKIYFLSTCSTCQRIMKRLKISDDFEKQDIKKENITNAQLEDIASSIGSYNALFSRRAMKYRAMGLNERELTEEEIKDLILSEYTFIKRPIIQMGDDYFIGNSKKVIDAVESKMNG